MFNLLTEMVEGTALWAGSFLNFDFPSYGQLETDAGDGYTLISRDTTMLTLLEISGAMEVTGPDEYRSRAAHLFRAFHSYLQVPGHSIDAYFVRGLSDTRDMLKEALGPYRVTSKRLGMDMDDLFAAKMSALEPFLSHEAVYIALYTAPAILTKEAAKLEQQDMRRKLADRNVRFGFALGQDPVKYYETLHHKHAGFVRAVAEDFKTSGMMVRVMPAGEAVNAIRFMLFPDSTPKEWRPRLISDGPVPVRAPRRNERDASWVVPPKLRYQVIANNVVDEGDGVVRVGRHHAKTVFLELPPYEVKNFDQLFNRIGQEIPWSMHMKISGGGLEAQAMKRMVVAIFGFISDTNKNIKKGFDLIKQMADEGDCPVTLKASFSTWGTNKEEVMRRSSTLAKAVVGWGTCSVDEVVTNAPLAYASSTIGYSDRHLGVAIPAPLSEVARMIPLSRPASPWTAGAVLFRTPDGKLYPYQPGSSVQDAWVTLIFAPMGSGKSVIMNAINLACCLAAGNIELPYIVIIDVGPSSSGLISLLEDALPEHRRHQVAYHKLTMSEKNAINPFDTQLGMRVPTPIEREAQVNFLSLIGTPPGSTTPYDGVMDLAGLLVDEAYKFFADNANPKKYERNVDEAVDKALDAIDHQPDDATTWWEVVDTLFKAGNMHDAWLAQRYAVPTLPDLMTVVNSKAITDIFAREENPFRVERTGERLVDSIGRMISTAIREYPVLSGPSRFSLGDARVVSIDLNEVARGVGEAGKRQAAIMFQLARLVATKNFYLMPEMLDHCPGLYRSYHETRIKDIRQTLKVLAIDELHRTGGIAGFRNSVMQDIREGRKWNIMLMLASQFLEDFDEAMVDGASAFLVLRSPNSKASNRVMDLLGLSESARKRLDQEVHGPGPAGANLLAWFRTKRGNFAQIVTNTLGPVEMWAFSTTADDVAIRSELYKRLGGKRARAILAHRFPGGSAKPLIEQYRQEMGILDDSDTGAIERIVGELVVAAETGK